MAEMTTIPLVPTPDHADIGLVSLDWTPSGLRFVRLRGVPSPHQPVVDTVVDTETLGGKSVHNANPDQLSTIGVVDIGSPTRGTCPRPQSTTHTGKAPRKPRIVSTAVLRAEARRVIEASGKSELWGLHVQARTVTLLIGQTSAGKTTLLHTLAVHLAEGREFLGIAPPRPLRVLYADYESTLDVFDERFSVLGQPEGLDFIHPDTLPRGRELLAELHDAVTSGRYDVVVVDPLVSAFPVKDENDNAEASAQMDEFKALARTTGAAVILVHNSGRGRDKDAPEDDPHYGRGASARGDRADVELTYRRSGKSGHGHRFLYVTKSRRRNLGERIDIEFTEGGGFRRATPRAEVDGAHCGDFTSRVLAAITEQQAETSKDVSRRQVEAVIGIARDSAESKALTRTLADLVDAGQIVKGERGLYRIAHLTDPPCDV